MMASGNSGRRARIRRAVTAEREPANLGGAVAPRLLTRLSNVIRGKVWGRSLISARPYNFGVPDYPLYGPFPSLGGPVVALHWTVYLVGAGLLVIYYHGRMS